jgi:hypothetical protein
MRRRIIRLLVAVVVIPAAGWAAEELARRLEESRGPSPASHLLHGASSLAQRVRR